MLYLCLFMIYDVFRSDRLHYTGLRTLTYGGKKEIVETGGSVSKIFSDGSHIVNPYRLWIQGVLDRGLRA